MHHPNTSYEILLTLAGSPGHAAGRLHHLHPSATSFSMNIGAYGKEGLHATYSLPQQIEEASDRTPNSDQVSSQPDLDIVLQRSTVQYPDSLDPYSFKLNRWRIRATAPESCREISFRTINYLKHMYALFREQHIQQPELYGYPYSPSPLLYGRNGIATINFEEIPAYWRATFYNKSQARQACAILYALFDEPLQVPKKYGRPDELWTKLLKQMLDYALIRDYCSPGHEPDTIRVQ